MSLIRKVAVLGAGVMGSGIAAHVANAGIPVLLLDIVPPEAGPGEDRSKKSFRNKFALAGARQSEEAAAPRRSSPPPRWSSSRWATSRTTSRRIAECDWVVEVVKEDMAVKQALFAKVEPHLKPGAIVSSNTSGLSVTGMLRGPRRGLQEELPGHALLQPRPLHEAARAGGRPGHRPRRAGPHGPLRRGDARQGHRLGKDTPNFVANRIGTYGMLRVLRDMQKAELTVEEVDAIFGPAMGRPKSAVFRTADIVGLDTFVHVAQNCYDTLTEDEERETLPGPRVRQEDGRSKDARRQDRAGLLQEGEGQGRGERDPRPRPRRPSSTGPQAKVRFDSLGAAKGIDDVAERIRTVLTGTDKAAKFAERVTLDVAGLRQPPHPGDLPTTWSTSTGRCAGASPGTSAPSRSGTRTASARAWSG